MGEKRKEGGGGREEETRGVYGGRVKPVGGGGRARGRKGEGEERGWEVMEEKAKGDEKMQASPSKVYKP